MEVRTDKVRSERQRRGWTQQQLAEIADLSLRTVQRVENQGLASHESVSALAAVFEIDRADLLVMADAEDGRRGYLAGLVFPITLAAGVGALLGSALTWLMMNGGG